MLFRSENRAGLALLLVLGEDALIANQTMPNACGHVNWHHYHCSNDPAAAYYDPTDNVGVSTAEWLEMFGNRSLPGNNYTLARNMHLAVGIDHSMELDQAVHEMLIPYTSGCLSIMDCLHGGKPTHYALPDETYFLHGNVSFDTMRIPYLPGHGKLRHALPGEVDKYPPAGSGPLTVFAGDQYDDTLLINHVLHSNAFGLVEEQDRKSVV